MKAQPKPLNISVKYIFREHPLPDARIIRQGIRSILSGEKKDPGGQLTVCFVDDAVMTDLNKRYLEIDGTTDVLAFNYGGKTWSADIVVCVEEALRNSRQYATAPEEELCLCVAHGLLHLLGYDDKTSRQQELIQKKQKQYVQSFLK